MIRRSARHRHYRTVIIEDTDTRSNRHTGAVHTGATRDDSTAVALSLGVRMGVRQLDDWPLTFPCPAQTG